MTEDDLALLAQRVEEARPGQRARPRSTPTRSGWRSSAPLRELDEVAYLRFASVYRASSRLEDFEAEIALLRAEREQPAGAETPQRRQRGTDDRKHRDRPTRTRPPSRRSF